ncbi:MAG: hypothetical protein AMXMBFR33_51120 [Candidatus Xenobia bacterium]
MSCSKAPPVSGDVFSVRVPGKGFVVGLVVKNDAKAEVVHSKEQVGKAYNAILIHIYRDVYSTEDGEEMLRSVNKKNILIPPATTNRLGWSRGVFNNFSKIECLDDHLLDAYCFRSGSRFYDENGLRCAHSIPCGTLGLHSYLSIEDDILRALDELEEGGRG